MRFTLLNIGAILVLILASSNSLSGGPTPVMFKKFNEGFDPDNSRPWEPPDYSKQKGALGWTPEAFAIPKGMEARVSFWLDIYTKFTSHQGLLHDSRYVNIVYEVVDFSVIDDDAAMTLGQKQRARRKMVKEAKKKIENRLKRLQKMDDLGLQSETELDAEEKRYLQMFHNVDEKRKFVDASRKGRLRFQLGQKDRFIQGIYYSGRYLERMEEIFREVGVPIELTRLPFVESSFNFKARSKVGASGIWQFMRSTGRLYMKIDGSVDERNEPIKATESAAKMLKQNYKMLEDWPLAVTAYNHGPAGMRRMVRKFGTEDLEELVHMRKGRFGFASANFYASFLAALEAEKRAKHFFGPVTREKPLPFEVFTLTKSINKEILLKWFDGDLDKAKMYNPHLRRYFWKGYRVLPRKRYVLLPPEKIEIAKNSLETLKNSRASYDGDNVYVIGRGDTLSEIAENLGVSLRELRDINGIDNPRRIRSGQKLIIPPSRKN